MKQTIFLAENGAQKALDSLKRIDGFTTKEISPTGLVTTAINYMMFAVAAISVIMIIIGGIRYATSGGSADKVKAAKNTILYACIGLAIALLALAIVSFIKATTEGSATTNTSSFTGGGGNTNTTVMPY